MNAAGARVLIDHTQGKRRVRACPRFFVAAAAAFMLGVAALYYAPPWVCGAALFAVAALYAVNRSVLRTAVLVALAASGMAACYLALAPYRFAYQAREGEASLTCRVLSVDAESYDDVRVAVRDVVFDGERVSGRFSLWLDREDEAALPEAGDRIALNAKLTVRSVYGNPGSSYLWARYTRDNAWVYFQGTSAAQVLGPARIPFWQRLINGFADAASRAARGVKTALFSAMPEHEAGLAYAMLAGDASSADAETYALFREGGILHLLAVSGLHVGFLAAMLAAILSKLPSPLWLRTLLLGAVLVFYMAVCGYSTSVVRAGIMAMTGESARYVRRGADTMNSAGLAALVILIFSPLRLFDAGFMLSFSAVAGIALLSRPMHDALAKLLKRRHKRYKKALDAAVVSVSAQIGVLPGMLNLYGSVPLIAFLVNPLVVPLAALAIILAWITVFLSVAGLAPLAGVTGWGSAFLLRSITEITQYAVRYNVNLTPDFFFGAMGCAAVFALIFVLSQHCRLNKRKRAVAAAALCLVLCAVCAYGFAANQKAERVVVLDVGEGQCVLIKTAGQNILVDCGTSAYGGLTASALKSALVHLGAARIDLMILSHPGSDHVCFAEDIIENLDVRRVVAGDAELEALAQSADGVDMMRAETVSGGEIDGLPAAILYGDGSDDNESSLVVAAALKDFSVLVMSDVGARTEAELVARGLGVYDVLIVGHHGSGYSTGEALVRAVTPRIALISSGRGNIYGHPSADVVARLALAGAYVCDTQHGGAITVQSQNGTVSAKLFWPGGCPWE